MSTEEGYVIVDRPHTAVTNINDSLKTQDGEYIEILSHNIDCPKFEFKADRRQ